MSLHPPRIIIISDDEPHTPHQLRPDLRDRNPQVRPYALARVEEGRWSHRLWCRLHTVLTAPVQAREIAIRDTLLYVATLHGEHTAWQRSPIQAPITIPAS
jgi:hypothetical protein